MDRCESLYANAQNATKTFTSLPRQAAGRSRLGQPFMRRRLPQGLGQAKLACAGPSFISGEASPRMFDQHACRQSSGLSALGVRGRTGNGILDRVALAKHRAAKR